VEKFQKQGKSPETRRQSAEHLLRRLLHQLRDGASLERSIGDAARMLVTIAQQPGFADRSRAGQRRPEPVCQPPAAPQPVMIDWVKAQRVERLGHDVFPLGIPSSWGSAWTLGTSGSYQPPTLLAIATACSGPHIPGSYS